MIFHNFPTCLAVAGVKPLQAATIMGGTFVLEDAATLLAAMQVASARSLCRWPWGRSTPASCWVTLGFTASAGFPPNMPGRCAWCPSGGETWATTGSSRRIFPLVVVSRFVPGLRLPTYTTLGFLRAPLSQFALSAIFATLIWTSGLFFISLKLGVVMMHYLGVWRWAGLGVFLMILVVVGRVATRLYNKRTTP